MDWKFVKIIEKGIRVDDKVSPVRYLVLIENNEGKQKTISIEMKKEHLHNDMVKKVRIEAEKHKEPLPKEAVALPEPKEII